MTFCQNFPGIIIGKPINMSELILVSYMITVISVFIEAVNKIDMKLTITIYVLHVPPEVWLLG